MATMAATARADESNEVTFHAGRTSLNTKATAAAGNQLTSAGNAYGLRYLRDVHPFVSLGVDMDFLKPAQKEGGSALAEATSFARIESSSMLGVVRVGPTEEKTRPYFLLGLGAHFTSIRLDLTPKPGFGWADTGTAERRTLVNSSGTGIALKIQGGGQYAVTDNFLAGAYLAYHALGSATYDTTAASKALGVDKITGAMSAVSYGVELTARF